MSTFAELAANVRASIDGLAAERATHANTIREVATATESREPSEAESVSVRSATEAITSLDVTLADLRERAAGYDREQAIVDAQAADAAARGADAETAVRVGAEPATYTQENARAGVSFFRDMYAAAGLGGAISRSEAQNRQNRFAQEQAERATSTGSFAGLVVPQYLVDDAAVIARAGRPFANIVNSLPLPEGGEQLVIPRGTVGATTAIQATENSAVSSTDEVWANLTVPVVTIAGQQDVSRQSLERGTPGIDALIFADLSSAYAVNLDVQALSGTGASGQILGLFNTPGIAQSTAFAAAVTPTTFVSKVAGAINSVQTTRFLAPDVIVMHPRRWSWLLSQVDSSGRPLVVPNANGPFNAFATFDGQVAVPAITPVGSMLGLPVITDASIPTSVGTASEDVVVVARKADLWLWEDGDGAPTELRFEQTLGNQLTVKLVEYGYAAFTAGRYPGAVAVIGGNSAAGFGLVAPTF